MLLRNWCQIHIAEIQWYLVESFYVKNYTVPLCTRPILLLFFCECAVSGAFLSNEASTFFLFWCQHLAFWSSFTLWRQWKLEKRRRWGQRLEMAEIDTLRCYRALHARRPPWGCRCRHGGREGGGGRHRDVVNVAAAGNIVACLLLTNLATVTPIIAVRRRTVFDI